MGSQWDAPGDCQVYMCFVDLEKACIYLPMEIVADVLVLLATILLHMDCPVPVQLVPENWQSRVGVCQSCPLSPILLTTMMDRSFMHTLGIESVCFGGLRIGCLVFQIMWSASSKQKRIRTCIRAAEMYFLHWMSGLYLRDRWGAKSSVKGSK